MLFELHFAENAFTLHLLLQRTKRLIDVVVSNQNLHLRHHLSSVRVSKFIEARYI